MFSVIIPVYNGEKFIDTAIECVLKQTYKDWELIVINDGSSDKTADVLKKHENDSRINIIHQKNSGVSAARNTGVSNASGSHIAFLDADDIWMDNHLSVLAEMIEKYPDAGLYATFAVKHLVNGKKLYTCNYFKHHPETVYLEDFFAEYDKDKSVKMYAPVSTCVSKEAALRAGGFPVGCKIGEDLAFSLIISAYYPVVLTSRCTAVYEKINSTATKDTSFDPDWYFFEAVKDIIKDTSIPYSKRRNIENVMKWYQMRRSRHYMINGEKKKAIKAYREIGSHSGLGFDKFITLVMLFMPCAAVKRIFAIRWRSQA